MARYFRQRGQPDVGRAEIHVGDARSRDIHSLVAEILDDPGEQAIRGTGKDRRFTLGEYRLEDRCRSCHAVSPALIAIILQNFQPARLVRRGATSMWWAI